MGQLFNLFFPKVGTSNKYYDKYLDPAETSLRIQKHSIPGNHPALNELWYLLPYKQTYKSLLLRAKFQREFAIYDDFAKLFFETIDRNSIIVPVPPDPKRYSQRRYHGPYRIARYLAKHGLSVWYGLEKTHSTPPQTHLKRSQRLNNIQSSFALRDTREALPTDQSITIIDDVVTTGATILECAKVLHRFYPNSSIEGLAIAGDDT